MSKHINQHNPFGKQGIRAVTVRIIRRRQGGRSPCKTIKNTRAVGGPGQLREQQNYTGRFIVKYKGNELTAKDFPNRARLTMQADCRPPKRRTQPGAKRRGRIL
ncbi:MAG: hypothetical protein BWY15_01562 [Firmicutes bacterium ADurb.Bin193]|nr:MAG: hypothetical protein BWY15_01562 [Firmicutes bacterium ADurb.Bin193]